MAARGGSGARIPSGLDLRARVRVNFPDPEGSVICQDSDNNVK